MAGDDPRPDPDALLRAAAQEGRGRLKIFLGAAPGVGKTFEMLSEGAARRRDGVDVVVAVVETHGRVETEALVRGQVDDAYWRLRQAIALDPTYLSAYNTLGVVYLRRGDAAHAERVLHYALKVAPDNPRLLANDAEALGALGRTAEAAAVRAHLAAIEPTPPFYWFVQGQTALHQGDFLKARSLFLKELDRAPDYHEFHYALAVADFELNRLDEARREMALAMDNAVKRSDHDLYSGKLDKLNAWRAAAARSRTLSQ